MVGLMKSAISFLILLITNNVFAFAPLKLQIMFKDGTSVQLKDELHKKVGAKLEYRGKNLAVDLVSFNKDIKPSEAFKYCKEYQKVSLVKFCEQAVKLQGPPSCEELNSLSDFIRAPLSKALCNVLPSTSLSAPPGLHPLWSQMRIGSDLVRHEVNFRKAAGASFTQVSVGNIDSGFNKNFSDARGVPEEFETQSVGYGDSYKDHGTKVINLIAGEGAHGASANARVTFIRDGYSTAGQFIEALDNAMTIKPEVLNLELHTLCVVKGTCGDGHFGPGEIIKDAIKSASHEMIVVAAAGNHYPNGSPDPLIEDENVILVGSSDPFGLVSEFSDESSDITILAPSDYYQRVPGPAGDVFGGTSGAAPLVSASVADIKSILGDLKGNEAAKILKLSSTKLHVTNAIPQRNGAGQLNSFKAFKLAEKLKAQGWPADREALLVRAAGWNFREEALAELNRAKTLLNGTDCESYKAAFNFLRKAFLLDESNEEVRNLLTVIYSAQGYPAEAQYIRNFKLSNFNAFIASSGVVDQSCGIPGCEANPPSPTVFPNGRSITRAQAILAPPPTAASP
jgi:Subtilase family